MNYLSKYPNCIGCPMLKYCGTVVSSTKLCNSYSEKGEAVVRNNTKYNFSNNRITEQMINNMQYVTHS